jgi:CRISPR-associated endonuclease/helicase Cas3
VRSGFTGGCGESIEELCQRFADDGIKKPDIPDRPLPALTDTHRLFEEALKARMLFGCLVDADFLNTEQHFDPAQAARRPVLSHGPNHDFLNAPRALEILLAELRAKPADGEVNRLRRELLDNCLQKAANPPGLFSLTAPTGSGKTLSSLAFALRHIELHNKPLASGDPRRLRRIIVVIPYTSIIEQTAGVFRELFEAQCGPDYILEHHGAVAPRELASNAPQQDRDTEDERMRRARLAQENWDAPLIVTTSVRFFESLFACRTSDCRKLHNIARSVILFDEVQTLPHNLVPSLLSGVSLLTREPYGCTAVFMTATQPAFASAKNALPFGWNPTPIETDADALSETLRRTRIQLPTTTGAPDASLTWNELATQLINAPHQQALCVLNTTKDARALFRILEKTAAPGAVLHLSARMCPAHRRQVLAEVRRRLHPDNAEKQPCILVSTQLIEAGVDVDFPIAYRALGPLDSIIQTAGRCNREGRRPERCLVIVFHAIDGGIPPGAYATATAATVAFLKRYPDAGDRLHLPQFYADYFAELYKLTGRDSAATDPVYAASARLDFPAADAACRLVDSNTRSVLVQWKRGQELIKKLRQEKHLTTDEWRETQHYSVNLYEQGEFLDAKVKGYVTLALESKSVEKWFWAANYDEHLGACHAEGEDFCP